MLEQWGPVSLGAAGTGAPSLRARLSTPPALGFVVLVLTLFPAYLLSRPEGARTARAFVSIERVDDAAEAATEELTAVEIEAHIREVAIRYRISPLLVAAIVEAESEFNPRAVSRRGARGLMQLMPRTASSLRVEDMFDPFENIEGGVRHLRRLMNRYNGNLKLVLAAYNAGEQAVAAYGGVPPYRETRRYVARILRRIGHGEGSPVAARVARRGPEARAETVANPDRIDGPARAALERRTFMEIDRSPAASPGGEPQGAGERPATTSPRSERSGHEGL